jgi:hypothetical protein
MSNQPFPYRNVTELSGDRPIFKPAIKIQSRYEETTLQNVAVTVDTLAGPGVSERA